MTTPNSESEEKKVVVVDEGDTMKSGENDHPKAITGAVEAGWGGSVAGTNDALVSDEATDKFDTETP